MLRVSYQESDGWLHMAEMQVTRSEMLKLTQEQLIERFGMPGFAVIQNLIKERKKAVKHKK